jgi:hypothetical protein
MAALSYAIAVMFAVGLLTELITVLAAPVGYQDDSGFHRGSKSDSAA